MISPLTTNMHHSIDPARVSRQVLTAPEKPGEPLRCEEVNNTKEDRQKWRLKYKWDAMEKKSYVVFEVGCLRACVRTRVRKFRCVVSCRVVRACGHQTTIRMHTRGD